MAQGTGTFDGAANLNVRIPMFVRTPKGNFLHLDKPFREALLSLLGQTLNQEAMGSSRFTVVSPDYKAKIKDGEILTYTSFIKGPMPSTAELSSLNTKIGMDFNVEEVPGGYILEFLNFDEKSRPDVNLLRDSINEILNPSEMELYPSVWAGDFVVAKPDEYGNTTYEQSIEEFRNEQYRWHQTKD